MSHIRTTLPLVLSIVIAMAGCATPQTRRSSISEGATKAEAAHQTEIAAEQLIYEQQRLSRVYRQLATKSYALCGDRIGPSMGAFMARKVKGDMGDALARLFGIQDQPTVTYIVDAGPAAKAGVKPRDVVLSINGVSTSDNTSIAELMENVSPDAPIALAVDRAGVPMAFTVQPERACRYSVMLSQEQNINAFADGTRIMVARGMMSFARDDNDLALVISHELAHNIMKHIDAKKQNMGVGLIADIAVLILSRGQVSNTNLAQIGAGAFSQEFEAEADYVGLYIMANAGLPITDAPRFWRRMAAAHPASIKTNHSASHPSTAERMVALEQTVKEINEKIAKREPLIPNMKDGKVLAMQPEPTQAVEVRPVAAQPAPTQAVEVQPVAAQPAVPPKITQPSAVQSVAAQPAAIQPATVQPAAIQPVSTQPVATQPVAASREQMATPAPTSLTPQEEKLRELKRLNDAGLISQEIYLERQRKILEDVSSATTEKRSPRLTVIPNPMFNH